MSINEKTIIAVLDYVQAHGVRLYWPGCIDLNTEQAIEAINDPVAADRGLAE